MLNRALLALVACAAPVALAGYAYHPGYIPAGGDLGTLPPGTNLTTSEAWCDRTPGCEGFTFTGPEGGPAVGTVYFKNNAGYLFNATSTWCSYVRIYNPCDIYATAGTPCVAAHSVVRALYGNYSGALYQVNRSSDGTVGDVGVLSAGGVVNASAQDAFCAGSAACLISRIYDQSGRGNHLGVGPPGGNNNQQVWRGEDGARDLLGSATPPFAVLLRWEQDSMVNATAAPTSLGGHKVYGAYFEAGDGYRVDNTSGIATGNDPETLYMVTSGQRFNGGCCFECVGAGGGRRGRESRAP